ncbi:hypothetical protein Tco_1065336, partial [Tanacetum coccineum]
MPLEGTYSVEDVAILNARRTPIQKQPETLLCLVGLSRRYFLGDDVYPIFLHDDGREMDLFNLISAPNPVVIKTGTRPRTAHEETPTGTMNLDPISFAKPSSVPEQDIAQSLIHVFQGSYRCRRSRARPYFPYYYYMYLSLIHELVDHLAPPGYFSELRHLPNEEFLGQFNMTLARQAMEGEKKNLETLLEAEADMRKVAKAKNAELVKEMESLRAQFTELQDERVSARCAEMDSRLDALSIDFDEELYPHMLTGIDGRRWGEAKLDLAMVEGYDSEAEGKFIATMQALKDLKYPLIDELENLRDAPMDV